MARWPLLASLSERDAAWQALRRGEAFINEQLARREGIAPGDRLSLVVPYGTQVITVAGIYPDYGNPRGELVLTTARVQLLFEVPPTAMGVVLSPGISAGSLRQALRQRFNLGEQQLQDQREVKAGATVIFERTFAITRALNALTLAVAGAGAAGHPAGPGRGTASCHGRTLGVGSVTAAVSGHSAGTARRHGAGHRPVGRSPGRGGDRLPGVGH
ncbi:hypothetical protein MBH78_20790 [Oceanimonas sp. NS1]|nr:hypothetical protein [Oceanimonas sp. NS1]